MTLISKNPIKIILMVILLFLAYNLYSNKQGNTISYLLIVLGLYLIYNDKTLEGLVDTDYENKEIETLLGLDVQRLFGTSAENLTEEQVKQVVELKAKEIASKTNDESQLNTQTEISVNLEIKKKLKEENPEITEEELNNKVKETKETEEYQAEFNKKKEEKRKENEDLAKLMAEKMLEEENKVIETKKLELQAKTEAVLGKSIETRSKDESNQKQLDEQLAKLIEARTVKMEQVVQTNSESKTSKLSSGDNEATLVSEAAIAKAVAPLQAEIAKLREQTAVPPNVMEAKLKNFNLLVDVLTEKGTLTEEDYENMKTKMSSNVMTIDEAIDALERLKLASKTVKRKEVQPEMKNWWSEMNRSELPLDMYIPKGSLVPNQFSNEFSILNTDKWTVPMPRPPVCIDSTPKDILPMGTTGYPTGLKYFDEARYVTTGAKQEKEKKMVAFDVKEAKKKIKEENKVEVKEGFCGCN